jgi:diaminohydroxyphosphoribosylaminopyrimidine deaminase/5-amino-6-(5-phosphoribosylamino)uracil reductase
VVIGCLDPNPDVNGKGVAMLRAAGIQVDGPVLEPEAKQLIAPFLARVRGGRPYVTLKWAETLDAKIAGPDGERMVITGTAANRVVHDLRSRSDAILVGGATLRLDDPRLTVRDVEPLRPLLRIALSARLQIPHDSYIVRTAREIPTVIYTSEKTFAGAADRVAELNALGVDVVAFGTNLYISIADLLRDVGRRGATHLLVESGGALAGALLVGNLSDRLWVFKSSHLTAPPKSRPATEIRHDYIETGSQHVGKDTLSEYLNPRSDVFFAPEPSADFVLAQDTTTTSSRL